jgi:hypothetical protein
MKTGLSSLYVRRKPTNWLERGVEAWARDVESLCDAAKLEPLFGFAHLAKRYFEPARIYFALAARSRAKSCAKNESAEIDRHLFRLRSVIERAIYQSVMLDSEPFEELIFRKGFFGYSIKQGVTARFPLFSCIPTEQCGGACYAHDGRDKHLSSISRGVFNYIACEQIARDLLNTKESRRLSAFIKQIDKAISFAKSEAIDSKEDGFVRPARIRLSHVGEMADLPEITNWIASEISKRSNNEVHPVIYTRHPKAAKLDAKNAIVNFTIESDRDARKRYAPSGARLVGSSWGGEVLKSVAINFLEHHGDIHCAPIGLGSICPVTVNHEATPTCDLAKCTKCFVWPKS